MQMVVHKGRGNYEPNSIEPDGERETPAGFRTAPIPLEGTKVRLHAESFKDHYSQARSIKGKVNSKYFSGDWKEQGCSLCFPAQVMLRGSWVFALRRSILFS
jgi:hypothetical protein